MDTLLETVCKQVGEEMPVTHSDMSPGMRTAYVGTLFLLFRELWEALHSRYRLAIRNTPYDPFHTGEHPPLSRDSVRELLDKMELGEYGAQLTEHLGAAGAETANVLGRLRADLILLQDGCAALRRYANVFEGSAEESEAVTRIVQVVEGLRPGVTQTLYITLSALRTCSTP